VRAADQTPLASWVALVGLVGKEWGVRDAVNAVGGTPRRTPGKLPLLCDGRGFHRSMQRQRGAAGDTPCAQCAARMPSLPAWAAPVLAAVRAAYEANRGGVADLAAGLAGLTV
jgi:hypothetical protein